MSDDISGLIGRIQKLDDLGLSLLLSIVANEHCMVEVPDDGLGTAEERIRLV